MSEVVLSKSQTVLNLEKARKTWVCFEEDVVPWLGKSLSVPREVWEDMGQPEAITVTVEPGDTLNP